MSRVSPSEAERDAIQTVARLMAVAARTAPKGRGLDGIQSLVVEGDDIETLARAMEDAAESRPDYPARILRRDALNLRKSSCAVLLGASGAPKKPEEPLDCGACGFKTCSNLINARSKGSTGRDFAGPNCVFASLDLGIALGSAVKVAATHNVDNRVMYTMGVGAATLKWLDADVIIGIPLSASGKSIYFDRS